MTADRTATEQAVQRALDAIAPVWPLDRYIAVNPWWRLTDRPIEQCSAELAALHQAQCLMPRSYYRERWARGEIGPEHLRRAAAELAVDEPPSALLRHLEAPRAGHSLALPSDLLDGRRDLVHQTAWHDEIEHQVSQSCAAYFDAGQAGWRPDPAHPLYCHWLAIVRRDRGMGLLMDSPGLHRGFAGLPEQAEALIGQALAELEVPPERVETFCHALLRRIHGWAAWCAHRRWEAELAGGEDDHLHQLLAVRLAWELVLVRRHGDAPLRRQWQAGLAQWPELTDAHRRDQRYDWVWQTALELAYQDRLIDTLSARPQPAATAAPVLQAVFCIDVRSEVYRRALEAQDPAIQTLGYAGFFGLPLAYRPAGTEAARPQLPGLLAPAHTVTELGAGRDAVAERRGRRLERASRWQGVSGAAPGAFSFVEAGGWLYALKLLKRSFFPGAEDQHPVNALGRDAGLAPRLALGDEPGALPLAQAVELAEQVLRGMSLTGNFAPLILLVGHGSASRNNPHAAGLDCGACGGQTGEVNARVLAGLLNDARVREGLRQRDLPIPQHTRFLPALHNTTTDQVSLLEREQQPAADGDRLHCAEAWLARAGEAARAERARRQPAAGGSGLHERRRRAADWSQVRPEWGLAGNASLIIAPRARLRGLDLGGRSFLHDYRWQDDPEFSVLTRILTAPMVVAHWINLQYYASVTDNHRYGSGNKVLHNVVGGHIGVFEGNGGDLRTGLSLQSLHDGRDWVHTPLRLSVFVDAPRQAIAEIVQAHPTIRQLVDHRWLYLFQLERPVSRYLQGEWRPHPAASLSGEPARELA